MSGRSRIDIINKTARSRAMTSVDMDVLMIVGVTEWGPMNEATVVYDYPEYCDVFGGLLASYETPISVKNFFDMGGTRAVITRICHITSHTANRTPTTAAKATHTFKTDALGTYVTSDTLKVDGLYYGTLGNRIKIKIQDASNGEAAKFDLLVYLDDVLVDGEWYRNLSMLDTDDNYVEDIINTASSRSRYIAVTDLALGGSGGLGADERPENTVAATALTGGDDGLANLVTGDYVGAANYNTGLHAFNLLNTGDLLVCPDDTSSTFQNAAMSYCEDEKKGKVLFVPDPIANSDAAGIIVQAGALTASECRTSIPWPKIKIANPSKTIYGKSDTITVGPAAAIAGRMAKNSQTEKQKYFVQPSNEIFGLLDIAVGLESDYSREDTNRDKVTDFHVNPICDGIRGIDNNYGVWLDDCQLSKTSGNFHSIGEGHGLCYLRKKFELYLQRHRTQNNTETRRRDIKDAFESELLGLTQDECFASQDASEAFYVNTDPDGVSLNNPVVQDTDTFVCEVGIATARPMRFIRLVFTRDNRAVESYIQQQLASAG